MLFHGCFSTYGLKLGRRIVLWRSRGEHYALAAEAHIQISSEYETTRSVNFANSQKAIFIMDYEEAVNRLRDK